MAKSLPNYDHLVEEDYIDMDISSCSSTTFLCYTISSPPHSREFEFHMSTHQPERETTNSPADELFYKGKLLPLHLPPRLEMVQMLLRSSTTNHHAETMSHFEEKMPITDAATTTNIAETTPFESCNISPANSCYVSGELNPEEYFHQCYSGLLQQPSKKSWSKRLKLIKQSSLCLKLKASRAYLKSLFSKADQSCSISKDKECSESNGNVKGVQKNPQIHKGRYPVADANTNTIAKYIDEEKLREEDCSYRRSFSGIIKWHSATKSSSVSSSCSSSFSCSSISSVNSSGVHGPQMLKRSNSVNSEVETSIQGAIAYCKKSQQSVLARKSVSDVEFYSLSASKIAMACENQDNPVLCREY